LLAFLYLISIASSRLMSVRTSPPTPLYGGNASAVEALYEQYLGNPDSVPSAWRDYFKTLGASDTEIVHSVNREELVADARNRRRVRGKLTTGVAQAASSGEKQAAVSRLIQVYSLRGHQIADIDPLGLMSRPVPGVF
jgi:2-oxoglutarate dehydrogenase E1 component